MTECDNFGLIVEDLFFSVQLITRIAALLHFSLIKLKILECSLALANGEEDLVSLVKILNLFLFSSTDSIFNCLSRFDL